MGAYAHQNAVGHGPAEQDIDGIDRNLEEIDIQVAALVTHFDFYWGPGLAIEDEIDPSELRHGGPYVVTLTVTEVGTKKTVATYTIADGFIETQLNHLATHFEYAESPADLASITL